MTHPGRLPRWSVMLMVGCMAATAVAACGDEDDGDAASIPATPPGEPGQFTTVITNEYLPLTPGTRWVYNVDDEDEGRGQVVVEVTRDTRQVMGVNTVVVRDTFFLDGKIFEDTLDWFAQDREGNVWYFGEDTKEYKNGTPSPEGSWQAGVDGAQPGIIMKARPQVGERYRQEYYPGEAEDHAEVLSVSERVTVPFGTYERVLKTKDTNPLDTPDEVEHKYYAPGVGLISENTVQGGKKTAELVEMTKT
jgi:hypothetical protein